MNAVAINATVTFSARFSAGSAAQGIACFVGSIAAVDSAERILADNQ
jgi:hypothetical protein